MKTALQTSLGCLFIALLLNAAFTFAQGLTLTAPATINPAPWLKIYTHNNPGEPVQVIILSNREPTIFQMGDKEWRIKFYP